MKLIQISATQHSMFDDREGKQGCQRKWHYNYVHKLKGPPTPAMDRGKKIHTELEHTLKTLGDVRDTEFAPYVLAALPHLPIADGKLKHGIERRLLVEQRIWLQLEPKSTAAPGLGWLGFIDLLFSRKGNSMVIWDHKTTSDFRYAKTPEELATMVQPISYARWAYEHGHKGMIDLVHLYIKTKPKCPKKPKVLYRNKLVSEAYVRSVWDNEILPVIPTMHEAAAVPIEDTQLLPPNTNVCGMYGGCEFRVKCGFENTISSMFNNQKKGSDMTMSFMEKLKAKAAKENAANASENGHTGVLSPDAASRTTPVESKDDDAETEETTGKRGRKKMSDAQKAAAKAKRELAKAEAAIAEAEAAEVAVAEAAVAEAETVEFVSNGHSGFTLYINCFPQKDINRDVEPTLFEDWFGPIAYAMNETAQEKSNKPHYMLLSYGDQKAMLLSAVQQRLDRVPNEMVVNTKSPGASDALSVLIPHASRVVRASG